MTDSELNKLSGEAIGLRIHVGNDGQTWARDYYPPNVKPRTAPWKPLLDRGQALMLVERLLLNVRYTRSGSWYVDAATEAYQAHANADLLRAIVTCAALLQRQK